MKPPLTVAIISNTAWSLVNFRTRLMESLREAGHRVVAVAPPDDYVDSVNALCDVFVPLKELSAKGKNPAQDYRLYREFCAIFRKHGIDFAFTFTAKPNIYGAMAGKRCGVPVVPTVNGLGNVFIEKSPTQVLMRALYRRAFRSCPTVLFQNIDDEELFLEAGIVELGQCGNVPGSGVDLKKFPVKERASARPYRRFLFTARLVREKGVFYFLSVAEKIRQSDLPAEFVVIGMPANNPSSISPDALSEYVFKKSITYLGQTDDMNAALEKTDVLVLPSYYREGIPRILLEGLAKGLPIITTDSVGCRETVTNEVNGLLIAPRSERALEQAVRSMLERSEEELEGMGRASRRLAEERFDVNQVVSTYLSILEA
ncbi:glycosyltransferase family 4 protein [Neolewinella aurantiaca]|uniref:Glycosyltransferase family 4 protein n=1 Tax=Neolewinella aurantiaca TaxID=2602767 RepID=A0A5C7FLR1_9BACT|nr:glycosyltransferase family 4 protein [Neolewinella aurantiaca]TXF90961.1 glycosyltransferase family 4 protein [Neolewinella aurantiaca]